MRGLAGLLTLPGRPDRPERVEAMRGAMGARMRHLHCVHQTETLTVCAGGVVPAPCGSGSRAPLGWLAVCDARLDNQADLAEHFGCADEADAVVLEAYARWGPDCVRYLKGDFALVVWDPRREVLFLARDRLGVRPMHYTSGDGWFAFASEAKALLALPDVKRTSSEQRIAEFLRGQMPASDTTMFDAIARLPAGHTLTVSRGMTHIERYWDWILPEPATVSDLPERLAALFTDAVARRTPASSPVAVTLSGGLDSSSIAVTLATLGRYANEPVPTYSIVFDGRSAFSERRYIEAVISKRGFEPHFLSLDVEDPFTRFDQLLASQDGLFLAPTLGMAPGLLAGLAPGTIVLDGHGGDEVISHGYERLGELAQAGRWIALFHEACGAARVSDARPLDILAGYYRMNGRGGRELSRLAGRLSARHATDPRPVRDRLLSPRLIAVSSARPKINLSGLCPREQHMAALADPGQQYALEVLDRKAAGAGLEARFPFWDEALIAFMLSVPADRKLRGGWTRWLMRQAMRDRLPDAVRLRRDKHDFAHHMSLGLKRSPAASAGRFCREADVLTRYLDLDELAAVRARVDAAVGVASGSDLQALWRATAVAEWIDFADRHAIKIV